MKILVIDDDKTLTQTVVMMIEALGGKADSANGAREAIRYLEKEHYEYILLDMRMPNEDGMWFIKNARIPGNTKVVIMSGFVPGLILREMYRLGACDYLEKPFDSHGLLDVLERQSRKGRRYESLQEVAA